SVAWRQSGGIAPSERSPAAPPSIARTRASVGGTMGSPSHHWRSQNAARTASAVSVTVTGAVRPAPTEGGLREVLAGAARPISPVAALPVLALDLPSRVVIWSTA